MKNLIPPDIDPNKVFTRIKNRSRSSKDIPNKKKRLENLQDYVFQRYEEYLDTKEKLEYISLSNISNQLDKKALKSGYTRNSKGYLEGEVIAEILKIQSPQHKNKCPYCGMDKPRTIDHYLPQSKFPEFSVFPPNLIPCCGHCNTVKNDDWIDNGKRIFINLYFDSIPNVKFLYAHIIYESRVSIAPTVVFELKNNGIIKKDKFDLIKSHYYRLNLLEEYSQNIEEEISNIRDVIRHSLDKPIEFHKDILHRERDSSCRKYGINYWRTAFLDALINCNEFFEREYQNLVSA